MSGAGAGLTGRARPSLRSKMLDTLSKPRVWIATLIASAIVLTILQTYWPFLSLSVSLAGSLAALCVALIALTATFAAARRALRLPLGRRRGACEPRADSRPGRLPSGRHAAATGGRPGPASDIASRPPLAVHAVQWGIALFWHT